MKQDKQKPQNSFCNIRFFLMLWSTMACCLIVHAQSVIEPPSNNNDIVSAIYYDYELTESVYKGFQCFGTLYLTLNITDDIDRLILERTTPHQPEEEQPPKFMVKRDLPLDRKVDLQDYPWRIRFRIWVHYKDGSKKKTDVYNINDYIDEDDLKLLYATSSTATLHDEEMDISLDNGIIHLRTYGESLLDIIDISGRIICSKTINGSESLDIHDLVNSSNAKIIVIKLQSEEKTVIKKLHIR